MKINLLDPGLLRIGGHHHDWDHRIANLLVSRGHDVIVYANAYAADDVTVAFDAAVRVEKLFRLNPYALPDQFDPVCGEIERQLLGRQLVGADLRKVADADLWFWPTLFSHQLLAIPAMKTRAAISLCRYMPPQNGVDVHFAEPGVWWRLAAKNLRLMKSDIRVIGACESEGLNAFMPYIGNLDPVRLPVPIDGTPRRRAALETIGLFGSQPRDEHGSSLFGGLIERALKADFKVVTQAVAAVPAGMRTHPGLTLLDNAGEFAPKLERCDLLVAPYQWHRYVGRGSGIIWQAIASGVPCVAPEGASLSRVMARSGSASLFSQLTLDGVFAAILRARENYPALAEAAFRAAGEWRETNGLARFVDAMVHGQGARA
jgi:hypothetical protein